MTMFGHSRLAPFARLRADRLASIDRFLSERYIEPGLLPCALLLVARRGELVHRSVLGHASLERRQRLAEDTIFRIYSMTKPVTSVAFMMLVEEGRIALDDPVARWIPSWRDLSVYRSGCRARSSPPARCADARHRPVRHLRPTYAPWRPTRRRVRSLNLDA